MQIQCPTCKNQLSSVNGVPHFCSNCGSPLAALKEKLSALELDEAGGSIGVTEAFSVKARKTPDKIDATIIYGSKRDRAREAILPENSFVGQFRIVTELGQGGMGTVYKAVHSETGQTVALKLLSKSVQSTQETIQRFQRESQVAASINHPRSTFVYQAGQHQGQFYITMELMTGGTLDDIVKSEGAIPIKRAVDYVLDVIAGLTAAHEVGIVHRDLKPSNCFIDQQGRVKIGDFGLAKSFVAESSLTQTGTFMGTPQYAAPEQLRASEVDERADIYAIGGTLFFLLCGRPPFMGNAAQVIASIASERPPHIKSLSPEIPAELSRIVAQALEKDPGRRPENLEELRQALLQFSSRGATTADIGRRMAAFYLDNAIIFLVMVFAANLTGVFAQVLSVNNFNDLFFANIFIVLVISVAYFAIQEWRWGTTLGKWLLGMRVVARGNRTPGLVASLARGAIVPGISYVANALPPYALNYDPETLINAERLGQTIELQDWSLLSWLPNLLCFINAKRETGFRGLHEVLTGTRVVRLAGALEYQRPGNVPVTIPTVLSSNAGSSPETDLENESSNEKDFASTTVVGSDPDLFDGASGKAVESKYGCYHAIGTLGCRPMPGSSVLLGRDKSLERDVWIVDGVVATAKSSNWEKRKSISRPTRLRILAENTSGDSRWVVTEAIKGMPLTDYVQLIPNIDWRSFRPLLRELAYELAMGKDDGTLPNKLGLKSVWLDQGGRTKLLDQPLLPTRSETESESEPRHIQLSPFQLLASLLDGFIEAQIVPAHVLTFRRELEILRTEPDSIRKIAHRLGELSDKPSAWRWDDRLGSLAITMGIECSMVISLATILDLAFTYFLNFDWVLSAGLMLGGGSVFAVLMGAVFGGGPVFRVSGVLLRKNKTLEPASALRCGLRNWVAWMPLIWMSVCVAVIADQYRDLMASSSSSLDQLPISTLMVVAMVALLPMLLVSLLGVVYAILRPARGLADLIAGTRLIRK
ncbi:MAG: protein kinase [Mariniblastus sp.]|nr:protein kinase [Mariniblastus sp.]